MPFGAGRSRRPHPVEIVLGRSWTGKSDSRKMPLSGKGAASAIIAMTAAGPCWISTSLASGFLPPRSGYRTNEHRTRPSLRTSSSRRRSPGPSPSVNSTMCLMFFSRSQLLAIYANFSSLSGSMPSADSGTGANLLPLLSRSAGAPSGTDTTNGWPAVRTAKQSGSPSTMTSGSVPFDSAGSLNTSALKKVFFPPLRCQKTFEPSVRGLPRYFVATSAPPSMKGNARIGPSGSATTTTLSEPSASRRAE